jgi:hypothetical protein
MRVLVDREPGPLGACARMSHAARARPERGEQRTMDLSAGAYPNLCRMVRISDAGGGPTSRGHW